MFNPNSDCLYNFFNNDSGYYIPFYQRQYSWDEEDIEKLMDDLYDGVRKICINNAYIRFIGIVILLKEKNPQLGIHFDRNKLVNDINNIIDGQQRLSTLSVMSILIREKIKNINGKLDKKKFKDIDTVNILIETIQNKIFELESFYSINVKKVDVDPEKKPVIIRAVNTKNNPKTDQWTLNGDFEDFYESDISKYISYYIKKESLLDLEAIKNEKLKNVINKIESWLKKTIKDDDFPSAEELVKNNDKGKGLEEFLDGDIDLAGIKSANLECYELASGVIKILALLRFLTHNTYLTSIECPNEDLAFDMFQSLNATGTPLTSIEVFKPLVVNTLGENYGQSKTKKYFDFVDEYFDSQKKASQKEKLTDEVLLRLALVYSGDVLGKRFSEQRDWLTREFSDCDTDQKREDFVHWLHDLCMYWKNIYSPKKPNRDTDSFDLITHLTSLGVDQSQADIATLCIYFLKDANHAMAHYLISLFYSKLLRTQDESIEIKKAAANDFVSVCKAASAFYTLWAMGAAGFPDDAYRDLFKQNGENISWKSGVNNQNSKFIKKNFRNSLAIKGCFDFFNAVNSKKLWESKAVNKLKYGKTALIKFCLFISAHDRTPDTNDGQEGLTIKGLKNVSPYLQCQKWFSSEFEVIEHIANQERPKEPYSYGEPDNDLYPGDNSVVDKIGNLTLWSRNANSSTYSEWPDKVYYYSTLTSLGPAQKVDLEKLKQKLDIKKVPPGLEGIAASSTFIANLAPIALRGQKGLKWNKKIIDKRTKQISSIVYDYLHEWLS